jgi:hypothetical protein
MEMQELHRNILALTPEISTAHHPLGVSRHVEHSSSHPRATGIAASQVISPRIVYEGLYRAPRSKTRTQLQGELAELLAQHEADKQYRRDARARAATNPVTDQEFRFWISVVCGKMRDRFKQARRGFRTLDEDHSGKLHRDEFQKLVRFFNLECMPDGVFDRLLEYTDQDGEHHEPSIPPLAPRNYKAAMPIRLSDPDSHPRCAHVHARSRTGSGSVDFEEFAKLCEDGVDGLRASSQPLATLSKKSRRKKIADSRGEAP